MILYKFRAIKKTDLRRFFLYQVKIYYLAGAAGVSTEGAGAAGAAGAEAAAGASTAGAGAGAGLLQAASVNANKAAIRAERIIFNPFELSYKRIDICQFGNYLSFRHGF